MDNRAIGFFDSGVGGLTSIPPVLKNLPYENIIYYGDTARAPYGSKSKETIEYFSSEITDFLAKHDVKMIVAACNTVSATCLDQLRTRHPEIPIIGVVSPTVKVAEKTCLSGDHVGVIATRATVKSGTYAKKIVEKRPDLKVFSTACPAFVPLIEEGIVKNRIMDLTIQYYLDSFIKENKIRDLILGCTHYPLIEEEIAKIYPDLRIISSSAEVSRAVELELKKIDGLAEPRKAEHLFFASDISNHFIDLLWRISEGNRDAFHMGIFHGQEF